MASKFRTKLSVYEPKKEGELKDLRDHRLMAKEFFQMLSKKKVSLVL